MNDQEWAVRRRQLEQREQELLRELKHEQAEYAKASAELHEVLHPSTAPSIAPVDSQGRPRRDSGMMALVASG